MRRCTLGAVAIVVALTLAACGSDKKSGGSSGRPTSTTVPAGSVSVVVTAQLEPIAAQLARVYQSAHKGAKVSVKVASAGALAAFAKGGHGVVLDLTTSLKAANPRLGLHPLGRDVGVVATSTSNPAKVADLAVFKKGSPQRTSVCAAPTPIGNFAVLLLQRAGVTPDPASVRGNCRTQALQQVAAKKLDAALVFRAEMIIPKGVKLLPIAAQQNLSFPFSYATVGASAGGAAFASFLGSAGARSVLTFAGYLP